MGFSLSVIWYFSGEMSFGASLLFWGGGNYISLQRILV